MNRKISLLIAALCTQGLVEQAQANHCPQKAVQFYAGLSGGYERMSGKRTDTLNEDVGGGVRVLTVYANNGKMNVDNATVSLIGGFLWKLPTVPILIGPEIFFGRGNALSSLKDSRLDAVPDTRFYMADLQRKSFYGILARAGYQFCSNYLASLSVGWDRGQFSFFRAITADQGNQTPTALTRFSKSLDGLLLGLGIEKRIAPFNVGLDLRMTQYRKITSVGGIQPAGVQPGVLNFSARPQVYTVSLRISYEF